MDKLIIRGGNRLSGTIPISGAKNAALTLIPCAILTEEPVTLRNLPRLADIDGFQHLMGQFGVTVSIQGNNRPEDFGRVVTYQAARITSTVAPYDLVRKMRASILVLGPIPRQLQRAGCAAMTFALMRKRGKGFAHGQTDYSWRESPFGHHSHFGRKERRSHPYSLRDPDRRAGDVAQPAAAS